MIRSVLVVFLLVFVSSISFFAFEIYSHKALSSLALERSICSNHPTRLSTLNIASRVFVINLPHRNDRRMRMEHLGSALGLDLTFVDAVHLESPFMQAIMNRVRALRIGYGITLDGSGHSPEPTFVSQLSWPQDIELVAQSFGPLPKSGSDFWAESANQMPSQLPDKNLVPLTNARKDFSVEAYSPRLQPFRLLTAAKIACWQSHANVIRQIAENNSKEFTDVSVVLEDDVDMEIDIRERLLGIWDALPSDWDILFLGHCWSDESRHPAIQIYNSSSSQPGFKSTALHPSFSPRCTHAYALTTRGARRLTLYLRHPPFAYSRALDQAIAWLVKSGKLRSYSVVPSVVVQRKVDSSDILDGSIGSSWKDELIRGVFA